MEFLRNPNTVANPLATFYPRLVDHELRILRTTSAALSTNPTGNTNLIPRDRLGVPRVLMKIQPAHKPTPKLNPIRETEVSPPQSAFSSPDETSHEVSSRRHLGEGIQPDFPESHYGAFGLEFRQDSIKRANIGITMEDTAKIHQWLSLVAPYHNDIRCQLAARNALEADQCLGVITCPNCKYVLLDERRDAQHSLPQR